MEHIRRCPDCGVTLEMLTLGTLHCPCDFFQKNDPFQEDDEEDEEICEPPISKQEDPLHKRKTAEARIEAVRKEIAIAVKGGKTIQQARRDANLKYDKGWRERGLIANSDNQWTD